VTHGQPDYGMYTLAQTIYRLADMGELASRLGSIVTFDRRGEVIWLDDFESDLTKWYNLTPGGGVEITASNERCRNGGFSAKVYFPAAVTTNQTLEHRQPYPVLSKIGFEASFTTSDKMDFIEFYLVLYDRTNLYRGLIRYNMQTRILQYYDHNDAPQILDASLYLHHDVRLFHTMKLVVDFVNKRYERLILDDKVYDMSAYAVYPFGSGVWGHLLCYFNIQNFNDEECTTYIDDVILTQNEI